MEVCGKEDFKERTLRSLKQGLGRLWRRRSVTITEYDPSYKVAYLGNVITGWAKGEGCVEKPLNTLWKNYNSSNKPDVQMKLSITQSGLKAVTKEHGLTEYWSHRVTYCVAPAAYPKVFCWVYRHEGRKLKQELRCHAVICRKESTAARMAAQLSLRLAQALVEFKRDKISRQNARLSLANAVYDNPSLPRRKILLSTGQHNYRPPLERSKSAPKLMSIEESMEEEEEMEIRKSIRRSRYNSTRSDELPSTTKCNPRASAFKPQKAFLNMETLEENIITVMEEENAEQVVVNPCGFDDTSEDGNWKSDAPSFDEDGFATDVEDTEDESSRMNSFSDDESHMEFASRPAQEQEEEEESSRVDRLSGGDDLDLMLGKNRFDGNSIRRSGINGLVGDRRRLNIRIAKSDGDQISSYSVRFVDDHPPSTTKAEEDIVYGGDDYSEEVSSRLRDDYEDDYERVPDILEVQNTTTTNSLVTNRKNLFEAIHRENDRFRFRNNPNLAIHDKRAKNNAALVENRRRLFESNYQFNYSDSVNLDNKTSSYLDLEDDSTPSLQSISSSSDTSSSKPDITTNRQSKVANYTDLDSLSEEGEDSDESGFVESTTLDKHSIGSRRRRRDFPRLMDTSCPPAPACLQV